MTTPPAELVVVQAVLATLEGQGHTVPSRHVADAAAAAGDATLSDAELAALDLSWLAGCDALIAEVTTPSHGVGVEVMAASTAGLPSLALLCQGTKVSRLLMGLPGVRPAPYGTVPQALAHVADFLTSLRPGGQAVVPAGGQSEVSSAVGCVQQRPVARRGEKLMLSPQPFAWSVVILSSPLILAIATLAPAQLPPPPGSSTPSAATEEAAERPETAGQDAPSPKPAPPQVLQASSVQPQPSPALKIGGLWYLSYQGLDAEPSAFLIKRGYINIESRPLPFMSARITPDVTLDATGDLKVRLKYAYAKFHVPDLGVITRPEVEVGVAHMPWLDFEERINLYRMQDTMFMERNGLFNSADLGVTFMGLIGGVMPEEYQQQVSSAYPGRWGSFAVGVYNGGGYYAAEKNDNKALEGRATLRPFPQKLPGLQLSAFAVNGKGNTAAGPDWKVSAVMASYQCRRVVLTAQWVDATGNQKGTAVSPLGRSLQRDGWSVFAEGKLTPSWSLISRLEYFDPDTATPANGNKRVIAGVAHHLGKGNTVLLDVDRISYEKSLRPTHTRLQLTLQVRY